jgi:murein DD-endopeptidase MepM/ murein hydrolase activator NlpD
LPGTAYGRHPAGVPVTALGPTTTVAIRTIAGLVACLLVATGGALPPAAPAHPAAGVPAAGVPAAGPAAVAPAVLERPVAAYRWPLDGRIEVVRGFDPPTRRWHPGHRGVDLAAGAGEVVRAAGPGVVHFAGTVVDRGVVSVDHGGLRTTYEPVTPTVAAGDRVAAGDPIGVLAPGHAGCPRETCLHWGLRQGEFYLDPLALLGLGRTRLLPHPTPGRPRRSYSRRSRDCSRGLISTHVNNP